MLTLLPSSNRHTMLVACVAAAVTAAAAHAGGSVPPSYSAELLGPAMVVNDMNGSGTAVGWTLASSSVQAFAAGPEHPWELLPLPAGYSSAWAQGINDDGVVVGSAAVGGFPEFGEAVAWTPDGLGGYSITLLGALPGHVSSVAYAINNRGDIIGSSITPGFQGGPTVWFNSPEGVVNLAALGAPGSPKQINDLGVVVGINGGLFDIDTMMASPLPSFSGGVTAFQGWAINEQNEIAGTAFYGGFVNRSAANWTEAFGWQALGGIFDASANVTAYDINDSGITVMQTPGPAAHFPGIGTFSLSSLLVDHQQGQWLFFANFGGAVNDAGQIATISTHVPSGLNGVAVLTIESPTIIGDLNADGLVDGADLGPLLADWGPCDECASCPADLDGNCVIDGADLGLLLSSWT